jgi:hypothetical protein
VQKADGKEHGAESREQRAKKMELREKSFYKIVNRK